MICNEPCNGVLLYATPQEKEDFKKEIKHGFHKNLTRSIQS